MSDEQEPLFVLLSKLAVKDGVAPISNLKGCWERQVGDWWIAVNGHKEPMQHSHGESKLPPFECYVEFNGWPAGVFGFDGGIIAAGEAANEETFVAALEREIAD
jgi:hypothetical protein